MRQMILVAAAGGWWLAGCSGPSAETKAPSPSTRDLHLVEAPAPVAPPASDLEVGRVRAAAPAGTAHEHHVVQPTRQKETPLPAGALAAIALDRAPSVLPPAATAAPTETQPSVQQTLVHAPPAVEMFPAGGLRPGPVEVLPGGGLTYAGRGPRILIRGGRGGIDDDCDEGRPGHGVAINRSSPTFGGVSIVGRTPRLTGRFPR